MTAFRYCIALLGLLVGAAADADQRPLPPEESCPDGYYAGPRAGRKNYAHDKYLWVVTSDFARRYCMPLDMVDDTLKGAEAIAFRMSTSEGWTDRCAVIDGKEECSGDNEVRFDIFLRSDLNLPSAHPEVKFYDGSWNDAGWNISLKERLPSRQQYISGEFQLPPGKVPHFGNPFYHPDMGYTFYLVGVHQGRGWPIGGLKEWSYRARWSRDLDLLVLQDNISSGFNNPRMRALGIGRFAIVMGKENSPRGFWERQIPEDFGHTIWLPEKFYEKVLAAATSRGRGWFEQLRILRQQ